MPTLTRYFIKTAMVYLVLALLTTFVMSAQPVLNWSPAFAVLRPVYFHLFMVGWVLELIIGVAYWMFPKFSKDNPRRNERLAWSVYILLNLGLVLRAIGEPLTALYPEANMGWLLAVSAVFQLVAGWGFVFNTWDRVKER